MLRSLRLLQSENRFVGFVRSPVFKGTFISWVDVDKDSETLEHLDLSIQLYSFECSEQKIAEGGGGVSKSLPANVLFSSTTIE